MRYLTLLENKKLIQRLLAKHLPGLNFTMKSTSGANTTSLRIKTPQALDKDLAWELYEALRRTAYGRFDPMTDCSTCVRHTLNGETVSMYYKHVFFEPNPMGLPYEIKPSALVALQEDPEWPRVI